MRRTQCAHIINRVYPATVYSREVPAMKGMSVLRTHTNGELTAANIGETVTLTGWVARRRDHGGVAFVDLRDREGVTQCVFHNEADFEHLRNEYVLRVTGLVTKRPEGNENPNLATGEIEVEVSAVEVLNTAAPLPFQIDEHVEVGEEARLRYRYLDLRRPEPARIMRLRSEANRAARNLLAEDGYIEVETPVLQLVHGGATARPFRTHLNAFDQPMTMRIATELPLKRAVVGGIERVYEIGRVFRNEGVDSTHSPEFTTLECYETYADQFVMAERMKEIIQSCAKAVGTERIETENGTIDLFGEWKWVGVYPGLSEAVGVEITPETDASVLREIAEKHEVDIDPKWDAEKLVTELFGEIVEPTLVNPTFVYDYPPSAQPLARPHRSGEPLIEAWDLIIGGMERGTAFSELIDPVIQRERLTAQSLLAAAGDDEAMELDEDFLRALEHGAPPMGGLGLGIDRLIMLLAGDQDPERPGTVVRQPGLRETILFPLMKPEA